MDLNDLNDPLMLAIKKERVSWLKMLVAMGVTEERHRTELNDLQIRIAAQYAKYADRVV